MKTENEHYLVNQLKYLGLHPDPIINALKEDPRDSKLNLTTSETFKTAYGSKTIDFDLHFNKINDMVYLNGFTGKANGQEITSATGQNSFTAKELLNLSEGRAVYRTKLKNKEGEPYNAWNQLKPDETGKMKMNTYTDAYGYNLDSSIQGLNNNIAFARGLVNKDEVFDLNKAIENNPVLNGKSNTYLENFKKDLMKGNSVPLVLNDGQAEKTIFIEASPQFKGLDLRIDQNQKLQINKHETFKSDDDFRLKVNSENKEAIFNGKLDKMVAQNLTKLIPDKILDIDISEKKKVQLLLKGKLNLNKEMVLKVTSEGKLEIGRVGEDFDVNKSFLKVGQVSYNKQETMTKSLKV